MDVSLRQVRSFLAVARVKSFTRAASILNVTQPALTMQIRRLEEALGVTLFDRDTRSVELTRVARDLIPAFERALQDFDAALESARDIATQERGFVRCPRCRRSRRGFYPTQSWVFARRGQTSSSISGTSSRPRF